MSNPKYKDVGKKQIIGVINQVIHRLESLEMTLNMLVMFVDKDDKFADFAKEKLGGVNEIQSDETIDGIGDNSESDENS